MAVGGLGMAAPAVLLQLGRSLETSAALWAIAVLRILLGIVLIRAAAISRTPWTFRVLGVLLVFVGAATPLSGVERSRAALEWFANQGWALFRAASGLAVAFGLFLVWAVTPRRSASKS